MTHHVTWKNHLETPRYKKPQKVYQSQNNPLNMRRGYTDLPNGMLLLPKVLCCQHLYSFSMFLHNTFWANWMFFLLFLFLSPFGGGCIGLYTLSRFFGVSLYMKFSLLIKKKCSYITLHYVL